MTPEKLREIASYHFDESIPERLSKSIEYQKIQRDALDAAAATIETLQAEIASMKESKFYEVRT